MTMSAPSKSKFPVTLAIRPDLWYTWIMVNP